MENKFIPQAIEIVTSAIHEDNAKNYEEAFRLYKKALEHFMIGVKCKCARAPGDKSQWQQEESGNWVCDTDDCMRMAFR